MLDFLEAILDPIAEMVIGFFAWFLRAITRGEIGGSESKVQALFGNDVWWNSKESS